MTSNVTSQQQTVDGLDAVLHQLKTHDSRIGGLESKLDALGGSISEIKSSITLLGAKPNFDISKAITLCVQGGILFSMIVSGIIWLAVQLNASALTSLKAEDNRISERLTDMRERVTRIENRAPEALR